MQAHSLIVRCILVSSLVALASGHAFAQVAAPGPLAGAGLIPLGGVAVAGGLMWIVRRARRNNKKS